MELSLCRLEDGNACCEPGAAVDGKGADETDAEPRAEQGVWVVAGLAAVGRVGLGDGLCTGGEGRGKRRCETLGVAAAACQMPARR